MAAFRAAVLLDVIIRLLPFKFDIEHTATMTTGLGKFAAGEKTGLKGIHTDTVTRCGVLDQRFLA
jgi:hypothetical protein